MPAEPFCLEHSIALMRLILSAFMPDAIKII